jgi:DNA-binding NtrC family response regulator
MYRLNGLSVVMPPLSARPGDARILAEHILARLNRESKQPPKHLHPDALPVLERHGWPGNVRELENVVLREYLLAPGDALRIVDPSGRAPAATPMPSENAFKVAKARAVAVFEQAYICDLMSRCGGNISLASRLAGKDRSDLHKLLRKHGIRREEFEHRSNDQP